jgi:hypothetical protein
LSDSVSENTWVWADNSSVAFTNWAPDQPSGGEHCVELWAGGTWNDATCGASKAFLCSKVSFAFGTTGTTIDVPRVRTVSLTSVSALASVNDMDWPLAETVVLQGASSMRMPSLKAGCANLSLTSSSITLFGGASADKPCMASAVGSLDMTESAQLHVGRCDLDIRRVCADDSNGLSGSVFVMDTGSSLTGSNSTVLADGAVRLTGANKLTLRGVTLQVASSMLWSSSGMVMAIMGANLHILAGAKMTVTTSAELVLECRAGRAAGVAECRSDLQGGQLRLD